MKRIVVVTLFAAIFVAACGPAAASSAPSAASLPSPSAAAVPTPSATTPASVAPLGTVRLALDWTPNTNHTGFYVAAADGWYRDAGVDFKVLPYGTTTPEALIAAGQAECGISFQDALTFASAAGAPVVSVMAILQHTAQEIAVLASSDIKRPRDLDGRTYAGFGYPNEEPTLRAVIRADGGKGTFKTVTLDTAAYEALYAKRADFVITFAAWEGIEANERGIPLRTFAFGDYGFPDFYQVVLACDSRWLAKEPELARAFVAATVRGFQFAADKPAEAAAILVAQNPGVFDGDPKLPALSQQYLADQHLLTDETGAVGRQTLAKWQGYSGFLFEEGLLVDAAGHPLTEAPDYQALFTNDFLP
ncbi:MAG: ABC transporter substrate-binding protein [Chloroflexota bacterium]